MGNDAMNRSKESHLDDTHQDRCSASRSADIMSPVHTRISPPVILLGLHTPLFRSDVDHRGQHTRRSVDVYVYSSDQISKRPQTIH